MLLWMIVCPSLSWWEARPLDGIEGTSLPRSARGGHLDTPPHDHSQHHTYL